MCCLFAGLIVAILDHEHFRLKMLYKEKKLVTERLRAYKDKEKRWEVTVI